MKFIIVGIVVAVVVYMLTSGKMTMPSLTPVPVAPTPDPRVPNTLAGFEMALAAGQISLKLSDPTGIYDAQGVKIGYWTADGSVYDMKNVLVAKGLGGNILNQSK